MLSPSPFADRDCFTPAMKDNTPRPHQDATAAARGGGGGGVGGSVLPIAWGTWGTPGGCYKSTTTPQPRRPFGSSAADVGAGVGGFNAAAGGGGAGFGGGGGWAVTPAATQPAPPESAGLLAGPFTVQLRRHDLPFA